MSFSGRLSTEPWGQTQEIRDESPQLSYTSQVASGFQGSEDTIGHTSGACKKVTKKVKKFIYRSKRGTP
ncbi:hypothetical protein DENIT_12541 [Pseudomonas veronii]|nr:hypothetical protein DENIT_12541 [Pseudomonas veronii]